MADTNGVTRRPWFWALLALLSIAGAAIALRYYTEAFPVLSVDLRMTREEALDAADDLAEAARWEPTQYSQAASFSQTDPEVQTYVELEGGGPDAFSELVARGPYRPYVWQVRHFAEGEVEESWVRFTPEGAPYGFEQVLREETPRPSLPADAARALAEADARTRWGVDLSAYRRLETSQEVRPGGRTDHTFVYERIGPALGEASVRLRMVVAGDQPAELTHFVHVPEAFSRRYEEMRSANDTLALISNLIFLVVFLALAGGVGVFFLLRSGWVIWRAPLEWGFVVALLVALGLLNQLPLAWMGYDTAVSRTTFLLQQSGTALVAVVFGTPMLAFVFLAAESLTRRAFPKQPQQWRLLSRGVLNSDPVLGRTVGAYLWLGVDFGFVVLFYLLVSRLPGWWIPSEALVDPDLLATPFPWLMALSLSLFAGFWEESLFRGVPMAAAKLVGDRLGGTRAWVVGALVLQALVFAAAHANYPQQPSYARVAELFLPALMWGVFYLYFGLLPVILIHFLHNFTFFSIVLFSASDAGLWVDRGLALAFMVTPLAVVLIARRRWGRVRELPEELRNGGWSPPAASAVAEVPVNVPSGTAVAPPHGVETPALAVPESPPIPEPHRVAAESPTTVAHAAPRWLLLAGALGAVLWGMLADRSADAPPLDVRRSQAIAAARAAVEARGVVPADWDVVASVAGAPGPTARFVWETSGPGVYRELLGTYVAPPQWRVGFLHFTGPVEERAEEWRVVLGPGGDVREVAHQLPEERAGASLDEPDARRVALDALQQRLALTGDALREISADASQRPARRDWTFVYQVIGEPQLREGGELRVQVDVGGDEVVALRRFVHVPEAWERDNRRRETRSLIATLGSAGVGVMLLLFGAVVAVVVWSRGAFAWRSAAAVALGVVALQTVGAINGFPGAMATLSTAQPVASQLFALGVGLVVAGLVVGGGVGLLTGLAHTWLARAPARSTPLAAALVGGSCALALTGVLAAAGRVTRADSGPEWAAYAAAAVYLPALQPVVESLTVMLAGTAILLLLVAALDRLTAGWTRRRTDATVTLLWLGMLIYGVGFDMRGSLASDLARWAPGGLLIGLGLMLVYQLVRRFGPELVPVFAAVVLTANLVDGALMRPLPSSPFGALLAALLCSGVAWWWSRALSRRSFPSTGSRLPAS